MVRRLTCRKEQRFKCSFLTRVHPNSHTEALFTNSPFFLADLSKPSRLLKALLLNHVQNPAPTTLGVGDSQKRWLQTRQQQQPAEPRNTDIIPLIAHYATVHRRPSVSRISGQVLPPVKFIEISVFQNVGVTGLQDRLLGISLGPIGNGSYLSTETMKVIGLSRTIDPDDRPLPGLIACTDCLFP